MKKLIARLDEELFPSATPDRAQNPPSTGGHEASEDEDDFSRAFKEPVATPAPAPPPPPTPPPAPITPIEPTISSSDLDPPTTMSLTKSHESPNVADDGSKAAATGKRRSAQNTEKAAGKTTKVKTRKVKS